MKWNNHSDLDGQHAFLSASKYHWINYDDDKLIFMYKTAMAAEQGTILHALASDLIKNRRELKDETSTLGMFVRDCIHYNMRSEQVIKYSENAFGTADAISFNGKTLRIFDLKTGSIKAHMEQLMIYAAYFCLEYGKDPRKIDIDLRIYQNDDIELCDPPKEAIIQIMETTRRFSRTIDKLKEENT